MYRKQFKDIPPVNISVLYNPNGFWGFFVCFFMMQDCAAESGENILLE